MNSPVPAPAVSAHARCAARWNGRHRGASRAFTLIEVLIASLVMTILLCGILSTMLQSRRLTEGSIVQNSANTILQGYIEQIKALDFNSLPYSPATAPNPPVPATSLYVATEIGSGTSDRLYLSAGSPPTSMPALGTSPTGAVDNTKSIPLKIPAVNPNDTLSLNVWLWVNAQSDPVHHVTDTKSVTMIYTYTFLDGGRARSIRGTVRSVRSVVPTH
jgi:prepilin-type N-terminal cleavage/methylation domain-containing protein